MPDTCGGVFRGGVAAIAALVLAASLAACETAKVKRPSAAEDAAAITEFNKRYLKAINDGDSATLASLTLPEHIMIAPGRPPIVGKEANDAANARVAQMFRIEETWSPVETFISGDLAYQRGTFTVAATPKAGGTTRNTSGTFLRIYKRQRNGEWRMVRDMFNSDQPAGPSPLATPGSAAPSAPAAPN
jgi:ketosteroid isomerase-like protein